MKTIVVGYDETEAAKRALERAAELAQAFGSKVIVTSVAPVQIPIARGAGPIDPTDPPEAHAEELAWAAIFLFAPVSGVYYPIEVLPAPLQAVAYSLPSAYVFEGMRAALLTQTFRWDLLLRAFALNLVYLAIGIALFRIAIAYARKRGMLLQMGE